MIRTQVYLTKEEREQLLELSFELGVQQSILIREAIDQFIASKRISKQKKRNALRASAGLWADRDDLSNFNELRREFDQGRYS